MWKQQKLDLHIQQKKYVLEMQLMEDLRTG